MLVTIKYTLRLLLVVVVVMTSMCCCRWIWWDFWTFGHVWKIRLLFFDNNCNTWRRWLLNASGGGVFLPTGSVLHSTVAWPLSEIDGPCYLFSCLLRPRHRYFVVVLFLLFRSVVIRSCCIGAVIIWQLWWSCALMLMAMATIVFRC